MTMILKTKFQSLAAVVREIKRPDDLQVNVGVKLEWLWSETGL